MAPKVYMIEASPCVRSVLLTAYLLDIKVEKVYIDISNNEHLTPQYLKLNPQHTVPTFVDDDGTVIWDSHAIMVYLVEKYGKDDSLYPTDLYRRTVINQRLHFDSERLFGPLRKACEPHLYEGATQVPAYLVPYAKEAYEFLELFLEGHSWIAGDELSLADLSIIPGLTSIKILLPINPKTYPNLTAWLKRVETLPWYKVNVPGLNAFRRLFKGVQPVSM